MKTIFETFKKSVYNPAFYRSAITESFGSICRYYSKVVLFLSVVMTAGLGILLAPAGILFIKERAPALIESHYPAELVVTIKDGGAAINMPEPYIIKDKDGTLTALREQGLENILVIDTQNDFEKDYGQVTNQLIRKFDEYKTFALLTKNEIVTRSDAGQITIQSLQRVPTVTISQEILLSWTEKIRGKLGYIIAGGLFATFLVITIGYFMYLVPLLLFALIPFLIAYLKKTPLSYGEAYKMSLYAIVPALVFKTLLNIFGVFFLPSYFTLLVFMLIIALNMREIETPALLESK